MKEKSDSLKKEKKAKGDELVLPIIALAFAFYYIYTIIDLSWEAKVNGMLVGSILIFLIAIFLFRILLERWRGNISLKLKDFTFRGRMQYTRLGFLLLAIAYVVVIPWGGFTLTTFGYLVSAMLLLGVRSPGRLFGVALGLAGAGYFFFIILLETRFPPGPVERLIGWLV